jgi:hypothetical protein
MYIAMVDRHKDNILRKDINLKMIKPDAHEGRLMHTVFVHFPKPPSSYTPVDSFVQKKELKQKTFKGPSEFARC